MPYTTFDNNLEKIAIIGYAYKMPGDLKNDKDIWEMLINRETIQMPIEKRYGEGYAPFDGYKAPSKFASPYEALITNNDELKFDPKFFEISIFEAEAMDPQMKMILSCSFNALNMAGINFHDHKNSNTAVFVGTQIPAATNWRPLHGADDFTITGTSISMLANRISYFYNWMGPSMGIMTACSSGITAMDTAVNTLRQGKTDMALSGAVTYLGSSGFNQLGIVSPDGMCRSFDADGNGYIRSEGAFIYVLKRLSDAERDNDKIFGVIVDTNINTAGANDDSTNFSSERYITAPTEHGQIDVMKQCYENVNLSKDDIDFIEAHATGTPVGDKIEGNAIGKTYGNCERTLRVSSIKSNVGHMESASFTCGLLKVLMMFQHRKFAPMSKTYSIPNPDIDFDNYNMKVMTKVEDFPHRKVIGCINSFGFGGANGHCIIEEYHKKEQYISFPEKYYHIPISAKTRESLVKKVDDLLTYVENLKNRDVYTLAGNLSKRTTHFNYRTSFQAKNFLELAKQLREFKEDDILNNQSFTGLLMVFPGQGSQWTGCGKSLYNNEPVFKKTIDFIDNQWLQFSGKSLKKIAFHASQEVLNKVAWAQPVLFMIQVGMYELLKSYGVYADIVMGHSAGEVAATYASGVYTIEEACLLIYHRSLSQSKTENSGRMLVIPFSSEMANKALKKYPELSIACYNSPENTVVCGNADDIYTLKKELESKKISPKLLPGSYAFHSKHMDCIKEEILEKLLFLDTKSSWEIKIPFVSTVSGNIETKIDSYYWWENIRNPVCFVDGVKTVSDYFKPSVVLELSPHLTLRSAFEQCYQQYNESINYFPTLTRKENSSESFIKALGNLYKNKVQIDYKKKYKALKPISYLLPEYPLDEAITINKHMDSMMFYKKGIYHAGPLLGRKIGKNTFQTCISKKDYPWMAGHVIQNSAIIPAAGYLEMIIQAFEGQEIQVKYCKFNQPCPITDEPALLTLKYEHDQADNYKFEIFSKITNEDEIILHCIGDVSTTSKLPSNVNKHIEIKSLYDNYDLSVHKDFNFYKQTNAIVGESFSYDKNFQVVSRVYQNSSTRSLLSELVMDEEFSKQGYNLHPTIMDGALQMFLYFIMSASDFSGIPSSLRNFHYIKKPVSNKLLCVVNPPKENEKLNYKGQLSFNLGEQVSGRVILYDPENGDLVAYLDQYLSIHYNNKKVDLQNIKYRSVWQPKFLDSALPETYGDALEFLNNKFSYIHIGCMGTVAYPFVESIHKQYTFISDNLEYLKDMYKKYHNKSESFRFKTFQEIAPCTFELLFLDKFKEEYLNFLIPGGIYIVGKKPYQKSKKMIKTASDKNHVNYEIKIDDGDYTGKNAMVKLVEYMKNIPPDKKLNIITRSGVKDVINPAMSTIWGGVRSSILELNIECRLIDIYSDTDLEYIPTVMSYNEKELVIRNGKVWCSRLIPVKEMYPTVSTGKASYKLCLENPGKLNGLEFKAIDLPPLKPNEVQIDIHATALNFRDIMVLLDKLPFISYEKSAFGREIGLEASGVVKSIGSGVTKYKIGDKVLVMKGGCIANQINVHEDRLLPMPDNMTMEQGASILSVYVTAYYSLIYLSKMDSTKTILIHSAMGGVGQAAIAIAKHVGAKIYATAGSEEKRNKLLELGCSGAYDSHSFTWYDDLMKDTEGVDIVLNSLAGYHIRLCLDSLKPGGWHCEIGKIDIYNNNPMYMQVFKKNLKFAAIDIDRLMKDDPYLVQKVSLKCLKLIKQKTLPCLQITKYTWDNFNEAIRLMVNGKHQGKLVLTKPAYDFDVSENRKFIKKGTILMSGAMGGFGLRVTSYLASVGAKHIVLMDRDVNRKRTINWYRKASYMDVFYPDVKIDIYYGDVSNKKHVQNIVDKIHDLIGVFHLAGVLDDKFITDLDEDSFTKVFAPKAVGAWNLHEVTLKHTLDYFVMLSSITSYFGNPSQVNYGAANAFQDGLAEMRKLNGLPALSYNMSAVSDAGMASKNPHVLKMMKLNGTPAISSIFAIEVLDTALRDPSYNNIISILPKNMKLMNHLEDLRYGHLEVNTSVFKLAGNVETIDNVLDSLVEKLTDLCGFTDISTDDPLSIYGLNSISVTEFSGFLKLNYNFSISALKLMTTATCQSIAEGIVNDKKGETKKKNVDQEKETKIKQSFPMQNAIRVPSIFDIEKGVSIVRKEQKQTKNSVYKMKKMNNAQKEILLPHECQNDLNRLKNTIRKYFDRNIKSSRQTIKKVLVTGATGFVGRILIVELLRQTPTLKIYCLIRGVDGFKRLKNALRYADLDSKIDLTNVYVLKGDVSKDKLGLDDYEALSEEIDAIYHLATDLKLVAKYKDISNVNTNSISKIIDFATNQRFKKIFYASTMGIFPEYFTLFSNEYSDSYIESESFPDINNMKKIFPPNIIGYPWSKIVCEKILLHVQKLGLDIGIFRIPQTGISNETGFTQDTDIKIRLTSSVLQVKYKPDNYELSYSEPVDTICKYIVNISLNIKRKHTIYHCCNSDVHNSVKYLENFGYKIEKTSYENFRQKHKSLGRQSVLDRYWPLVDHFSKYWISHNKRGDFRQICTKTLIEDSTDTIKWPKLLEIMSNSVIWIHKKQNNKVFDVFKNAADFNTLSLHNAPGKELVKKLKACQNIKPEAKPIICYDLHLKNNNFLKLNKIIERNPEILNIKIVTPIFILGLNRTGTTYLHKLISLNDKFITPSIIDMLYIGDESSGEKRSLCEDIINSFKSRVNFRGIHEIDIDSPEEDFFPLEHCFSSDTNFIRYGVKTTQDLGQAYALHKKWFQYLSYIKKSDKRWLFKMPFHLNNLDYLFQTYPDAIVIQIHRNPIEIMPSWCNLVEQVRSISLNSKNKDIAMEQLKFMSDMYKNSLNYEYKNKKIDIQYNDLIKNPKDVVEYIYEELNIDFIEINSKIEEYLMQQKPYTSKKKSLKHYNITENDILDAFLNPRSYKNQRKRC